VVALLSEQLFAVSLLSRAIEPVKRRKAINEQGETR
jgi:hypothetical protein